MKKQLNDKEIFQKVCKHLGACLLGSTPGEDEKVDVNTELPKQERNVIKGAQIHGGWQFF